MLNVGIIGLGFMGATHIRAWRAAQSSGVPCRLVAASDAKPGRFKGHFRVSGNLANEDNAAVFDSSEVSGYLDPMELISDDRVNAIDICSPTDTHVELALEAIRAGKHVLIEKPVALKPENAKLLIDAERSARGGVIAMPAHCMRFWPAWSWLKARIDAGSFGAVKSATFTRIGTRPTWSSFYQDAARSGAAMYDLHIHDADFIRWCFGDPTGVTSFGHVRSDGAIHHVTTAYRGTRAGHLIAEGGWDQQAGFNFRMRYVVNFENATADFDIGREKQLLLCRNGQAEVVEVDPLLGYDHEVRYFANCCLKGTRPTTVNLDDALKVTELLAAEEASIRSGETVAVG